VRVSVADLKGQPQDGVQLTEVGITGAKNGLARNDIIVAVDGVRVRNSQHYRAARGARADKTVRFIVWHETKYIELDTTLRYEWPVGNMRDHKPGQDTPR
jgi:hypothetical protein